MEEKKKKIDGRKAAFERRRRKGYEAYLKRKHKEMAEREREEKKRKEKERKKKEKERLKRLKEKKKRPVGRPKKRGPKKKRKKKIEKIPQKVGPKFQKPYSYKIISCRNGVQNKFIGRYRDIKEAYDVFNALKTQDNNVIFPSNITGIHQIENSIDEYILIEKNEDKTSTLLRNEYGKFVEQTTNKNGWIIIDKFRYKREEEFWVYGYNSKNDRKTFLWIYNNLVISDLYGNLVFKRIFLYKNKIVIKNDANEIELVLCKDESDAVRFYNKTEEWIKRDKVKQVLFMGDYSSISDRRRKLEDELIALTGWTKKKVQMKNNTYYRK